MTSPSTTPEITTPASNATTGPSTVPWMTARPWNTTTASTRSSGPTRAWPLITTRGSFGASAWASGP